MKYGMPLQQEHVKYGGLCAVVLFVVHLRMLQKISYVQCNLDHL